MACCSASRRRALGGAGRPACASHSRNTSMRLASGSCASRSIRNIEAGASRVQARRSSRATERSASAPSAINSIERSAAARNPERSRASSGITRSRIALRSKRGSELPGSSMNSSVFCWMYRSIRSRGTCSKGRNSAIAARSAAASKSRCWAIVDRPSSPAPRIHCNRNVSRRSSR